MDVECIQISDFKNPKIYISMTFAEYQLQVHGYKCITTFWDDFAIADHFGLAAVKDTFNRAFKGWRRDYKYLTELVIVLNHRCWMHYNNGRMEFPKLYADLYHKANDWAGENLEKEEYEYFFNIVD